MSFFNKMFSGGNSSKKTPKQKEKENAQPGGGRISASESHNYRSPPPSNTPASPSSPQADDNVFSEEGAGIDVSQFRNGGKKDRNLSISRSGRHKYKQKMRSSVITGELYASSSDTTPNGSSSSAPRTSSSTNCRESQSRLGGSMGSSSQPTAV